MNRQLAKLSASARIAAFAAGFRNIPLSAAQRHVVYRAVLDTFAVTVAGRNDPASRIAEGYLRDVAGTGKASAWTSGTLMPPESAAWLNGIAGHVLDFDDVLPPMRGHPSVAMLPALIALAQATSADGVRLSSAYVAGYEVIAKIPSDGDTTQHYRLACHGDARHPRRDGCVQCRCWD